MTERLERFGLAGFGWGATWLGSDGELRSHRDIGTFRDDPARERVGSEVTRALLVHLRRPSKFSTIGLPDTQPFDDPAGRYAFSHNGDLVNDGAFRRRYRDDGPDPRQGRHGGRRRAGSRTSGPAPRQPQPRWSGSTTPSAGTPTWPC